MKRKLKPYASITMLCRIPIYTTIVWWVWNTLTPVFHMNTIDWWQALAIDTIFTYLSNHFGPAAKAVVDSYYEYEEDCGCE